MTISLAFLAPDLVRAAIEGRLPHGMGVARLADLPAEWPRQYGILAFLRSSRWGHHSKLARELTRRASAAAASARRRAAQSPTSATEPAAGSRGALGAGIDGSLRETGSIATACLARSSADANRDFPVLGTSADSPASLRGPVSAKASSNFLACFGAFVSVHEIPFPGSRDFSSRDVLKYVAIGWKAKHLVLAGPFRPAGRRGG